MKILLGVTGSISAYKACDLVRLFVKEGHSVRVVMTEAAAKFVTPLTFATLSKAEVSCGGLFDGKYSEWMPEHIALANFAEVFCVAPCTANVISKLACGIGDDVLTAAALACRAPLVLAPAMNVNMFMHPAVQVNISVLAARGVRIVEPGTGDLACGVCAKGRMPESEEIYRAILDAAANPSGE